MNLVFVYCWQLICFWQKDAERTQGLWLRGQYFIFCKFLRNRSPKWFFLVIIFSDRQKSICQKGFFQRWDSTLAFLRIDEKILSQFHLALKFICQSKVLWKKIPSWTIKHQKGWQVKNDFWTWKNQWRRRHFVLFCDLNKIFFQLKFLCCSLTWNWLISKSIYRWKIATHPSVSVKKQWSCQKCLTSIL